MMTTNGPPAGGNGTFSSSEWPPMNWHTSPAIFAPEPTDGCECETCEKIRAEVVKAEVKARQGFDLNELAEVMKNELNKQIFTQTATTTTITSATNWNPTYSTSTLTFSK